MYIMYVIVVASNNDFITTVPSITKNSQQSYKYENFRWKKKHEKVMLKLKNVRKKKAIYLNNE